MPAGRPREFDVDQALDAALKVFWRKGFEGTSLPDLTKAMGINRPSLYAAFGNKESLFRRAIDRYAEGPAGEVFQALKQPSIRGAIESLLRGMVELITDTKNPHGCFLVQSALACGNAGSCVRRETTKRRAVGQTLLRKRFEQAIAERDLSDKLDPADLARYITTISHGMAVQAASGASRAELSRVAEMAIRTLPF
jgi:AcrR family transcriptional regulator